MDMNNKKSFLERCCISRTILWKSYCSFLFRKISLTQQDLFLLSRSLFCRRRLFPFRKRSLPFETVVAISQNGRCHLKRSMPFFSSELHSFGLRTQKVAVTGSCVSLVIWVRVRDRVLFRVRAKNPSSSLEIFGLFFTSSFSFINVFFLFCLNFVNIFS